MSEQIKAKDPAQSKSPMKIAAYMLAILAFAVALSFASYCEEIEVKEWAPYSGVDGFSLKDGVVAFNSTSPMPLLTTKDNVFINASRFKFLEVRMKSDKSYATGKLFFRKIGDPGFSYYNSFEFQTGLNNGYHDYLVDLNRNSGWFGTVTQMILNPINSEGAVEIKSVKFLEPDIWLSARSFWKEFFTFARPLPGTINYMYAPKVNGTPVNTYVYWLLILISISLIFIYWFKADHPAKLFKILPPKVIMVCLAFWLLLDARTALDQFRSAIIDYQTFGGKSLEEKQALSTNEGYYDFYYFLKFCGEKIPSGSSYSLVIPSNAVYFGEKSRYYLYPTYETTIEAGYVLVYDPQRTLKANEIPGKGYNKYADFGKNRYILKRSASI
jgi:hypothetical protein